MSMPALPERIGRYRVESLLGRGGMGQVYKGFDPTLGRAVAIKTLLPDTVDQSVHRLYREAQACGSLQHAHIVTVYEASETAGLSYIVMEFLEGENLGTALKRGVLSFDHKIKILIQILEALQYAHEHGVIHRDIKPTNVHLLPDGSVKLLDFGLARVMRAETLTVTGAMMGTPYYSSPEQLKGERVDARTDVYSTGVLAYEMLTQRHPFEGDSIGTIVTKVLSSAPPPMDTSWSRAFPEVERIVLRAIEKNADARYASAGEMQNALSAFLAASQAAIASTQAEVTFITQKAIGEAKALISDGRVDECRELLSQTLRMNPDAAEAQQLVQSIAPPQAMGATAPLEPWFDDTETRPGRPTKPLDVPPVRRSRGAAWAVAAAVALALVATGVWMRNRPVTPVIAEPPVTQPPVVGTGPSATPTTPTVTVDGGAGDPPPASIPGAPPAGAPSAPATPTGASATGGSAPAAPVRAATTPVTRTAKDLFYAPAASENETGTLAPGSTGLKYRLVMQTPEGEKEVSSSTSFRSGDRVRLTFESNIDGYLYVVQEGSSGRWTVLFPTPQINSGMNRIQKFQRYQLPPQSWFEFDTNPGVEKLFVFLSKEPLGQLPGFKQAVSRVETVSTSVVEELQQSVRARDLVMAKDSADGGSDTLAQATYVVNKDEFGTAVSATLELVHKP
jgi:serine/threonine protein kinase